MGTATMLDGSTLENREVGQAVRHTLSPEVGQTVRRTLADPEVGQAARHTLRWQHVARALPGDQGDTVVVARLRAR